VPGVEPKPLVARTLRASRSHSLMICAAADLFPGGCLICAHQDGIWIAQPLNPEFGTGKIAGRCARVRAGVSEVHRRQ